MMIGPLADQAGPDKSRGPMRIHRLLNETEVSDLLGVHRSTLRRWRHDGQGPPWVRIEGTVRYPVAGLDTYLEARLTQAG